MVYIPEKIVYIPKKISIYTQKTSTSSIFLVIFVQIIKNTNI
jgi:hypothetical protein